MNSLESLQKHTEIVVDSGEIELIKQLNPTDATTNPSLILKALKGKKNDFLLEDAIVWAKKKTQSKKNIIDLALEKTAVNFGIEILKFIPGKISTEVDARHSFDTATTVIHAHRILQFYEEQGVNRERVLIKVAATWEGIQAVKQLQEQNINCNITLLFSQCQAVAAAQAKAYLISPFVGRILDWHKEHFPDADYAQQNDPGVCFVKSIYNHYKYHQVKTIIMGASFRNIDQITELAGCDKLTISPALLEELAKKKKKLPRKLDLKDLRGDLQDWQEIKEKAFRRQLNEDAMATEKLAEGICLFSKDAEQLEELIRVRLELNKKP